MRGQGSPQTIETIREEKREGSVEQSRSEERMGGNYKANE
jgi:hypothetical protein